MRLTVVLVGIAMLVSPVAVTVGAGATPASTGTTEDVTLRVTVVNAEGGPLGNAEVTVAYGDQERTKETVSNGEVLFDVPEGATVEITPSHPMLVKNNPRTVDDIGSDTAVTVRMYQPATATLSVVDSNGNPVEDVDVQLRKEGRALIADRGTTATDGTYTTPSLERGNYSVRVTKPGYYTRQETTTLSGDVDSTLEIEQGSVSVEFTVLDPQFDPPEPVQASLTVEDASGTIGTFQTDRSGTRGVTLDVNTRYTVTVEKDGYDSVSDTFRVGETDRNETFEIRRTPQLTVEPANTQVVVGQSLRVTVTDEYDEPAAGADVRVDGETVATTDENGAATLTIERADEVELSAVNGSVQSATVLVEGVEPRTDPPTNGTTETTAATTEAPTTTTAEGDGGSTPGFGVAVAVVALAAAALLARLRD